ncbi:hypothetical protein T4A_1821 [Trichinella pseudospiralis]|uniref:Uncharacterized protein n=1 Tax=Trichinella pseudospiralis TaxID=6337 RepID=A0A0V1EBD1_TRIPS|nr:hypothetical protein T4A_1821 [Trichinella pseudospiralis]
METLIIQRPSGNAAAGNRRALEQFLEALMYLSSEPILFLFIIAYSVCSSMLLLMMNIKE